MAERESVFNYSNQAQDIQFKKELTPHGEVGYLFNRSSDSFINNVEGQDYLAFRDDDESFCFVLCDGVGQSYCGQLAARILGDFLLEWLHNLKNELPEDVELATQVTSEINNLCNSAQEEVSNHKLPENLPDLLLLALNEQKEYGSEAVFVAGRVDFAGGTRVPLLNLYWLGDTQIHLFDKKENSLNVPGNWHNSERWSTKDGIRGVELVNHWSVELKKIKRLVVHSDGIKPHLFDQLFTLIDNPEKMRAEIEKLRSAPDSDDVTLISFDFKRKKLEMFTSWFGKIRAFLVKGRKHGIFKR